MSRRRHTPEQIVRKLREADRLLGEGEDVAGVCRHLEVSVQTYQRWRVQYKAMRPEDVVRLTQDWPARGPCRARSDRHPRSRPRRR